MPEHRRRRATRRSAMTPIGSKGYGAASRPVTRPWKRVAVRRQLPATATFRFHRRVFGGMAPPSSLPLLGDGGTSPSSRRLESEPMAHATDDAGAPAGPLGRKHHISLHLSGLATKAGEICGLAQHLEETRHEQHKDSYVKSRSVIILE